MNSKIKLLIRVLIILVLICGLYVWSAGVSLNTQKEGSLKFEELQKTYGDDKARQMTLDWLKEQWIVKDVRISPSGDIINILYINGLDGAILAYPQGTWDVLN